MAEKLDDVPRIYRIAHDLGELGVPERRIAEFLGIDRSSVDNLLRVAALKVARSPIAPSPSCADALATLGTGEARSLRLLCHGLPLDVIAETLGMPQPAAVETLAAAQRRFEAAMATTEG